MTLPSKQHRPAAQWFRVNNVRYLLILLLAGCVTEREGGGETRHQASTLQCVGYCNLTITDKSAEISADSKVEFKHGFKDEAIDETVEGEDDE